MLFAVCCLFLFVVCFVLVVRCSLFVGVSYCLLVCLFVVRCVGACFVFVVACFVLLVCMMIVVCCLWFVVRGLLFVVRC